MKKRTIRLILIVFCLITIVIGANVASKNIIVNEIKIDIKYLSEDKMLLAAHVEQDLIAHFGNFTGRKRKDVPQEEIEQYLNKMNFVETSKINLGLLGKLDITIKQSIPIAKIIGKNNKQVYLSEDGKILQTIESIAANVVIINGNIPIAKTAKDTSDSPLLLNLYSLAYKLYNDELLRNQISQVYFNKNTLDMLPMEGDYTIAMSSFDNLDNKLKRLVAFYTQGEISNEQLKSVNRIDLSFDNQVIITKKKGVK